MIAPELEQGTLVPLFDRNIDVPTRCCLMTTIAARRKLEVQAFPEWILESTPDPEPKVTFAEPRRWRQCPLKD